MLSVSYKPVASTSMRASFTDVVLSLPADVVMERIVEHQPALVRILRALCRGTRSYVERPPFRSLWDRPAICHDRTFRWSPWRRLTLPPAYARMLAKDRGHPALPYILVALKNGFWAHYLDQPRFERILDLLHKRWTERTVEDLASIGIHCPGPMLSTLAQDWTIIGLVNGVIQPDDFVGMVRRRLPEAFWRRAFPDIAEGERYPPILPLDWMQCGCEARALAARLHREWAFSSWQARGVIRLEQIARLPYSGVYHYVACMVSRRYAGRAYGAVHCGRSRDETIDTAARSFELDFPRRCPERPRPQPFDELLCEPDPPQKPGPLTVIAEVFGYKPESERDPYENAPPGFECDWKIDESLLPRQRWPNSGADCVLL